MGEAAKGGAGAAGGQRLLLQKPGIAKVGVQVHPARGKDEPAGIAIIAIGDVELHRGRSRQALRP